MAKLIVTKAGREKSFDFIDDIVFVGTSEGSAIRVQGPGIGEKHCQILRLDGAYRVVDLGFESGTYVNHERVGEHELANGDVIRVGDVTITFRGGVQPAGARESAPAPAARAPTRAATRRPGARKTAPAQRHAPRAGESIEIAPHLQKAARQRDVLVRRRVRKGGLTGPQALAVVGGVVLVAILISMAVFKKAGEGGGEGVAKAFAEAEQEFSRENYDRAIQLLASISEGASNYRVAQERLKEYQAFKVSRPTGEMERKGKRFYDSNIVEFIASKIETPDSRYAGDTAQKRYLVEYRLPEFLDKYPGHSLEATVNSLLAKYAADVPRGPPTWHDVDVAANHERARKQFGFGYVLVSEWMAANPGDPDLEAAQALREKILRGANDHWEFTDRHARQLIEEGKYGDALGDYLWMVPQFEGIDALHRKAKTHAEQLKERAEQLTR